MQRLFAQSPKEETVQKVSKEVGMQIQLSEFDRAFQKEFLHTLSASGECDLLVSC